MSKNKKDMRDNVYNIMATAMTSTAMMATSVMEILHIIKEKSVGCVQPKLDVSSIKEEIKKSSSLLLGEKKPSIDTGNKPNKDDVTSKANIRR